MRRVSLNMRRAYDAQTTGEVELFLFTFEHPTLDAPVRLSTDPTERLSSDPVAYGTRSSWKGADPVTDPYLFVLAQADLPDDLEDQPGPARIVLDNVDQGIAEQLRAITNRATCHMAVVLASSPDVVEGEGNDLLLMSADGDTGSITLSLAHLPIWLENFPADRITKDRFPGMFR